MAVAPASGNKTHDHNSYISQTKQVVVLLCVVMFAMGLNSIVQFVLRCRRRESPATTTGLKKRDLERIPVAVYGTGVRFTSGECPICLGEFLDGDKVKVLPKCKHGFHVRCIDKWLLSRSSCPNCRHSLLQHKTGNKDVIPRPATDNGNVGQEGS
ncbi:RING-H2 finger protein ATL74 [Hibiscus syriacus]|uniref:RING-type E3 ubiquitin transferase n=2 Tax=Hibiscus syriacus TaxID=106335 RepID=A0A6A3BBQ6_HIBSY|nr:RING-H2 finger protein ATL74 [Hibiscus syriacus]